MEAGGHIKGVVFLLVAARRDLVDLYAVSETRLLLTCGLPGAGKTTLATRLAAERRAVRLTKDEWQWALRSTPWDRTTGEKIEQELWRLAQEILSLGLSVVLDFGLWARAERDEMRSVARGLGVGVELHYLKVAAEELIDLRDALVAPFGDGIGRSELDGEFLPGLVSGHRDDAFRAELLGSEDREQTDPAVPDHGDGLAGAGLRGDGSVPAGSSDFDMDSAKVTTPPTRPSPQATPAARPGIGGDRRRLRHCSLAGPPGRANSSSRSRASFIPSSMPDARC